jgi:hypothetical protein
MEYVMILRFFAVVLGVVGGLAFAGFLVMLHPDGQVLIPEGDSVFIDDGGKGSEKAVSIYDDEFRIQHLELGEGEEVPAEFRAESGKLREERGEGVPLVDRLSILQSAMAEGLISDSLPGITRRSIFDGTAIALDGEPERPIAVMFDNFSLARPQLSGLNKASIVYEALAEGGITRLMGVFTHWTGDRVGPIRSTRHYFLEWAQEYSPAMVHAGGSPMAEEILMWEDGVGLMNYDEDPTSLLLELGRAGDTPYTYRDFEYSAPHNLFSNLEEVAAQTAERGFDPGLFEDRFCFDSGLTQLDTATEMSVNYSGDATTNYFVWFKYDPSSETYRRWYRRTEAVKHVDSLDRRQVAPSSVIVQYLPWELINGDAKERIDMSPIGSGRAVFLSKGYKWSGTWQKSFSEDYTRFYDDAGAPLCLGSGQVWISVVGGEELVEFY